MREICSLLALLLAITTVARPAWQQSQNSADNLIHVEVTGLRNDNGKVLCALYASSAGFPKQPEKAQARLTVAIADGQAVCEFSGIGAGAYAVSVFHDENSNGKLDTNFMGIPREGVGASNDAKGHFGPPKFDAASFHYTSGRMNLTIKMFYL